MDRPPLVFSWDAHVWWGFVPDPVLYEEGPQSSFTDTINLACDDSSLVNLILNNGSLDEHNTKNLLVTSVLLLLTFVLSTLLLLLRWRQRIAREELEMEEFHMAKLPEEITPRFKMTKRDLECFDLSASPRLGRKVLFKDQQGTPSKDWPDFPDWGKITPTKNLFGNDNGALTKEDLEREIEEEPKVKKAFQRNADKLFNINRFIDVKDNQLTIPEVGCGGEGEKGAGLNQIAELKTSDDSDGESSASAGFFSGTSGPKEPSQNTRPITLRQHSDNDSSVYSLIDKATWILPGIVAKKIKNLLGMECKDDPRRIRYVRAWYSKTNDYPPSAHEMKNTNQKETKTREELD